MDCIHPTPGRPRLRRSQMLYMDPEERIDCDDCVEARPIDAITSKDEVPPEWQHCVTSATGSRDARSVRAELRRPGGSRRAC